jgi:hypothetical protein
MDLTNRIARLEAVMTQPQPIHIARFILTPNNLDLMGYVCGDITIIREPGESVGAFHKRCFDAVTWPDITCRHIFEPLEGVCH